MSLLIGPRRALLSAPNKLFAYDSFSDADGTSLAAHLASDAGAWVRHSASAAGIAVINGDRVANENSAGTRIYYHSTVPPSADMDVSADFVCVTDDDSSIPGLAARISAAESTLYFARYVTNGNLWQLYRQVSGTGTQLGSSVSQALTPDSSYRTTLSVIGSRIRLIVDGVIIIQATDTNITAAGFAGLRFQGASTASTGVHIDNWRAVAA